MLFTYTSVAVFQTTRAMVLIFSHGFSAEKVRTPIECFEYDEQRGLFTQTPFATGCWTTVDSIFTGSIILASLGVAICLSLLAINGYDQFKVFNQSQHYTRTATVCQPPIEKSEKCIEPRASHLMDRTTKELTSEAVPFTTQKYWLITVYDTYLGCCKLEQSNGAPAFFFVYPIRKEQLRLVSVLACSTLNIFKNINCISYYTLYLSVYLSEVKDRLFVPDIHFSQSPNKLH